jgi:hypothetical protein
MSSPNIKQPQPIIIGSKNENPVVLNRNDADGDRGIWSQEEVFGKWKVNIREGMYDIRFKFIKPVEIGGRMILETGPIIHQFKNDTETDLIKMENVSFSEMDCDLIPFYRVGSRRIFPFWVELTRVN